MYRKICALFALAFLTVSSSQAQIYLQRTDLRSLSAPSGNISFPKSNTTDNYSIGVGGNTSYLSSYDVNNFHKIYIPQTDEEAALAKYSAPTYADDYRSYNAWSSRNNWQLANVHDPSVMKADDGYYYMYQTDASYGNVHTLSGGHFLGRRSKDLVNWEYVGSTMPGVPSWIETKLNSIRTAMGLGSSTVDFSNEDNFGYWAPCVRKVSSNLYRMYYAITLPGTITSSTSVSNPCFIGLMESTNPADSSSWVDKGYVITQYSDQGTSYSGKSAYGGYYKYNAIDPSYIITPEGEHWLIYGSWHSGFAAVQLNPETGKTITEQGNPWSPNESQYGTRVFTRYSNNRWQASEAPEVVYHDGYYYLFVAFDQLSKCYNTRVVRSKNVNGPYEDITGTTFTNGTTAGDVYPIVTHPYKFGDNHGWVGISHCAVFDDGEGNWYYSSQQRFPQNYNDDAYANAIMMGGVRRILWTSTGWPVVLPERYGNVPQVPVTEDELIGSWQNVTLNYISGSDDDSNDHMDKSVNMKLNEDHTISGAAFSGMDWAFDADAQTLTLGGSIVLYLAREADWEASPRRSTIVYAGLSKSGKATYWGKMVETAVADESEVQNVTTIGATDNTAAFWSVFSDYLTSNSGKCVFHYNFTNYTDESTNYDNWAVVVTNGKERTETDYSEYVVLRADNYGWQYALNTISDTSWYTSLTSNYNWDTFKSDMNGANVDLTIKIQDGTMTITAVTTTIAAKEYTMTFVMPVADGVKGAFLTCEKAHLVLDNNNCGVTELD